MRNSKIYPLKNSWILTSRVCLVGARELWMCLLSAAYRERELQALGLFLACSLSRNRMSFDAEKTEVQLPG